MQDVDFIQRIHSAEGDFLTALLNGTQMLASYHQTWSALADDLSTATKTRSSANETFSLAHLVASRISNIASCFLEVRHDEENISAQLRRDCDAMLHQMDGLNLNARTESSPATPRSHTSLATPTANAESSSPPFLAPAYRWLLDNLHNPYPSAEVKAHIAATSSCQISSVNAWFTNARRRIGWTALCRERFSNCRADMIDAAYRALVKEDPQRMLSPEVMHSFIAMKVAAEGLYSSTFTRSALAGDLDPVVKDMTEEIGNVVERRKRRQAEDAKLAKEQEWRSCVFDRETSPSARDSYPSPDRSLTTSPVPALDDSLTDESEDEDDVVPPIIAGSKRRLSSIEPLHRPPSTARRPVKRSRTSMTSRTSLPSPPSSTDGVDEPSDNGSTSSPPENFPVASTQPDTTKVFPSRKRRLSDADVVGIPKRQRGFMDGPRLHAVSDPLPRCNRENEYSIDDWFNTNFDALFTIPPPVDATEPDFSTPWEVELFRDYCIPRDSPQRAPKSLPAPMPDSQISTSTDLSEFESLLRSIGSNAFVAPSEVMAPSDTAVAPYSVSLDPTLLDISQSIDWTSLLNNTEDSQPTIGSTFLQPSLDPQPLPEIDLSILQLPHVMLNVTSEGDFASKQAKLHKLQAMQEAVWRMEQELQSEGVVP